jgi:hypothetical protein
LFDIRYSLRAIIHALPAAEGLAEHLPWRLMEVSCLSVYKQKMPVTVWPLAAMGWDNEGSKKRISNIEQRISNAEADQAEGKLHHSKFVDRYSLFLAGPGQGYYSCIAGRRRIGWTLVQAAQGGFVLERIETKNARNALATSRNGLGQWMQ